MQEIYVKYMIEKLYPKAGPDDGIHVQKHVVLDSKLLEVVLC
jgi:hypothetical protein